MKFGARIIKTGIALILAIHISALLGFGNTILAGISAAMAVQPSVYRTWRYLFEQVQANAIGAVIATLTLVYIGNHPLFIGVAVVLGIAVNLKLGFEKSIGLAMVTTMTILGSPAGQDHLMFAADRFMLIMIGILSSMLVNILFIPPKHEAKLLSQLRKTVSISTAFLRMNANGMMEEDAYKKELSAISENLARTKELFNLYSEELQSRTKRVPYASKRKAVIYKRFIGNIEKAASFGASCRGNMKRLDAELQAEAFHLLNGATLYLDAVTSKWEKKTKIEHPVKRNDELFMSVNRFASRSSAVISTENTDDKRFYIFSFSSSLFEFVKELDYLDRLVTAHRHFHEN